MPETKNNIPQSDWYNTLHQDLVSQIYTTDERPEFLNFVRQIESGGAVNPLTRSTRYPQGRKEAEAKTTTAKGVYQFTDASVDTAKNRMETLGFSKEFRDSIKNNPKEWTDDQADIMFLANLFSRSVKEGESTYSGIEGRGYLIDELLKKALLEGDRAAMEDLYYTLHHTAPDEATINRVNKISIPRR